MNLLSIILNIHFGGFLAEAAQTRFVNVPATDNLLFSVDRTVTTISTTNDCALLCLRTKYCNTFSICNTDCFIYDLPYAFLESSIPLMDAKTYRSIFNSSSTPQVCNGNFSVDASGKLCYLIIDGNSNRQSWNDALLTCLELGGLLITLETDDKLQQYQDVIQGYVLQASKWWIGGIDPFRQNKDWEWINGRPVNSSLWHQSEPSHNDEQCIELRSQWMTLNDGYCDSPKNFICEKPDFI